MKMSIKRIISIALIIFLTVALLTPVYASNPRKYGEIKVFW